MGLVSVCKSVCPAPSISGVRPMGVQENSESINSNDSNAFNVLDYGREFFFTYVLDRAHLDVMLFSWRGDGEHF